MNMLKPGTRIGWVEIGGSSNNVQDQRGIGDWWGIRQEGWSFFYNQRIQPYMNRVDGIYLHNPGGTDGGEYMQFDQWPEAVKAGLFDIADETDFRESTKHFRQANPGKFVGVYLGDVRTLLQHQPDPAKRLLLLVASLSPFMGVCDEICMDGASSYAPTDPVTAAGYYVVGMLASFGFKMRMEPGRGPNSLNLDVLAEEQEWQKGLNTYAKGVPQNTVIRVVKALSPDQTDANYKTWVPAQEKAIRAAGHTAALDLRYLD